MGVETGEGGEEEGGNRHKDEFKGHDKGAPERKTFRALGFVDEVKNKENNEESKSKGENGRGNFGGEITKGGATEGGVNDNREGETNSD